MVASSGESILEKKLFDAYTHINKIQREFNVPLELQRLLVIGIQSSGKSSLLESYAGFPLAYTSGSTGTRCPVEYTFRYTPGQDTPIVQFEGKVIDKSNLCNQVGKRMEYLKKNSETGFSYEILRVEIQSSSVPNIVIMDLPGIIPSPAAKDVDKKKTVDRIVQYYARDTTYSLVVVLKCTEHHETLGDIALLDSLMTEQFPATSEFPPPRNNWKKDSVMIVNRINTIMNDNAIFTDIKKTQKWFTDQQKDGKRFFVALKPDNTFIRENASDEEVIEFLKNFPEQEKKLFDDFKSDVALRSPVNQKWSENIEQYFTVGNAKRSISALWMNYFAKSLPKLIGEINNLLSEAKLDSENITQQIERMDPKKYLDDMRLYALAFVNNIKSLITSEFTRTEKGLDIFNYKNSGDYTFRPSEYGEEFYDELDYHAIPAMKDWKYLISKPSIMGESHLKENDLGVQLGLKLVGVSSFRRLIKVVSYCMYSIGMDDISDSDIYTMACDANRADTFSPTKVVSQMTRSQLIELEGSFKFLRSHILGVSQRYSDIAHDFLLRTEFAHLRDKYDGADLFSTLERNMSKSYINLLENQLQKVGLRMQDTIRMYSGHLRTDLPIRSMMMTLVNPIEDRILREEAFVSKPNPRPISSRNVFRTNAQKLVRESSNPNLSSPKKEETKINSFWWKSDGKKEEGEPSINEDSSEEFIEEPTDSKFNIGLKVGRAGRYSKAYKREQLVIKKREKEKRNALLTLSEFHAQNSQTFNLADLVEGGFTNLRPIEWSSIDYEYLRSVALELYIHYVLWITMDIEMSLENHVVEYLSHEGMDKLRENVLEIVSNFSEDDIMESLGINKEELLKKEKDINDKVASLEKGLQRAKSAHQVLKSHLKPNVE